MSRAARNKESMKGIEIEIKAQEGKQTIAMDMMPDVMIYGGAAGCVSPDTEYLTVDGWKKIKDYNCELIYQFNPKNKKLELCDPHYVVHDAKDGLYRIENAAGISQCLSMEHRFVFYKKAKSKKHFEIAVGDLIAMQQSGVPLKGFVETGNKRVPFNIYGKKNTTLKIFKEYSDCGLKYCFETPSSFLILRNRNHTFVTGNSGKSRLLLLKALKYAYNDPKFFGVIFRRTTGPLRNGGLFDSAKELYAPLKPHVKEQAMEIQFGSTGGGRIKFDHLEQESTAVRNHQGKEYTFCGFDELCHFESSQFVYLMSRLRSESVTDSFLLATCNPDGDSWVLNWVLPYLNEGGYPIAEKSGKMLYYVLVDNEPKFFETENEAREAYPDLCKHVDHETGEVIDIPPKTFVFISGSILDNPALIRINPQYLANLKQQTAIERARLLEGCWFAREQGDSYFSRDWLNKIDYSDVPNRMNYVRAWDKAAKIPSDKYKYPDYTASIKMGKDQDGNVYIFGDYDLDAHDEGTKITGRFRRMIGERDKSIAIQGHVDGPEVTIVLPKDPSGAGIVEYQESAKKLIQEGFTVVPDSMPNNKKKVQKFSPFSSACQNGFVYIVEDSFPNKETLDHFYKELEVFNGERSTATIKDDLPDACASAFNTLQTLNVYGAVPIPSSGFSTTSLHNKGLSHKKRASIPSYNTRFR